MITLVELLDQVIKDGDFRPFGAAEGLRRSNSRHLEAARVCDYGLQRVCAAWSFARSSFNRHRTSLQQANAERPAQQSAADSKPSISDEAMLDGHRGRPGGIELWEGEGHRNVWAQLRVCRNISDIPQAGAPNDAREQPALAAIAAAAVAEHSHVGEIIFQQPTAFSTSWIGNRKGVSGRITVEDGCACIFTAYRAMDHQVRRLACVQARRPLRRPSADLHGDCEAVCQRPPPVRRGELALRNCDHGSQISVGPLRPTRSSYWGIFSRPTPSSNSPRPTASPRGSHRTLKEQIIHGRIYRNIAELRNAVRGFVEQYNAQWIVEKNGYLSPAQARQAWHTAMSLRPAA